MAGFRNRVLKILDNIYGFLTPQHSVSNLQLATPITLVHDVAREAELGSGIGEDHGWYMWSINNGLTASTFRWVYPISDQLEGLGLDPRQYSAWWPGLFSIFTRTGIGSVSSVRALWRFPPGSTLGVGDYDFLYPIFATDGTTDGTYNTTTVSTQDMKLYYDSGVSNIVSPFRQAPWLYLPKDAELCITCVAGGAVALPGLQIGCPLWIGKNGVTPPGYH